ncbi:hydroquinone glucosyltransferase-like [Zingiber officinale]|uniref:hydroquinone glucosyltransferase-like n=1 Tax=Zingiber officinale TaxID=94328 RepID=UPI001C4C6137|nr:hydroquinone glucosyltransferase-like [Zingiber officinale]
MLEAAKRLLLTPSGGRFSVIILLINPPPEFACSFIRSLASSGLDLTFHDIPPSEPRLVQGPPDITSFYADSRAAVPAAISDLLSSVPVAELVFDFFAALLALFLHLPALDEKFPGVDFEEMVQDVVVPGVFPIPPQCMLTPLMDKKGRGYSCIIDNARRYHEARGILVNTVEELELAPLAAIRAGLCLPGGAVTQPVHPVGPIIAGCDEEAGEKSVRGLDVRLAREAAVGVGITEGGAGAPGGGGFVSHCGWNSCVESMWYGVMVLPWPHCAEQHMNTFVLMNELGVAMAMRVERGDI